MSRALPEMTWLTRVQQTGFDVTIEGRCLSLTSLSDFVGNLEALALLQAAGRNPVERSGQRRQRRPRHDSIHDQGDVPDGRHRADRRRTAGRQGPGGQEGASQGRPPWLAFGLSKQPWHVQLAVFVLLGAAGVGAFYYLYEMPKQAELATRNSELQAIRDRNTKGAETARQLPEFRSQISELEARLEALKPILPEEKDVGDLLRRIQTLATQSNLTIRGFRPQPIAAREIHAEWPIGLELEGNYHNLGAVPRSRQQLPADHQRREHGHHAEGRTDGERQHPGVLHGDDVRAGGAAASGTPAATPKQTDGAPHPRRRRRRRQNEPPHVRFAALALVLGTSPALVTAQAPAGQDRGAGCRRRPRKRRRHRPRRRRPPTSPTRPEGRRDPFVALVGKAGQQRGVQRIDVRAEGVPGIGTDELSVRGIIQSQGA